MNSLVVTGSRLLAALGSADIVAQADSHVVETVTEAPTEAAVLGVAFILLGIGTHALWQRYTHEEPEFDLSAVFDEALLEAGQEEHGTMTSLAETHKRAAAPAAVDWETRAACVGEQWTTTLYIADYPDYPSDGYLNELFTLTDIAFDCTVRLHPKNQSRARSDLQKVADDLQVDADLNRTVRGAYLQERAREAATTYTAVESGQRVFSQSMFVTVRAETKAELREAVRTVRRRLRDYPANLTPKTAIARQDLALQASAPLGPSRYGREAIALGGAVGALLASVHNPTILEPDGIEFGVHRQTEGPVVINAFARENGYAMFTVGDPGSGKSFGAKQNFLRTIAQSEDRIGIVLEPLNDWAGVADALNAQRITVGGSLGLNPLEIKPIPEHVQKTLGEDASPFNEKKDSVLSFLTNFFALRGVTLDDRRTTLEAAIAETYRLKGITEDVATHANESPTMRDVLDVLEAMIDNPAPYVVRTDAEGEKLSRDATWLIDQLRPFAVGGRYENLGRSSEFDIRDEKIIYLDLGQ